jgi:hypothetical protein
MSANAGNLANLANGATGGPMSQSDTPPQPPGPPRLSTRLTVDSVDRDGFRGEPVLVSGHAEVVVEARSAPAEGLRLTLELVARGRPAVPLGDVVTDRDGRFHATVELPRTLPLGDYQVVVRSDGDQRRAPSRSVP